MSKHTPGEWILNPFGRGVDVIVGDRIIAECKARNGSELASCEANARLIAVAPDLLEALKGLFKNCAMVHKYWGECSNAQEAKTAIDLARTAVAKAEEREVGT